MLFKRKKKQDLNYTTYEADSYYYEQFIAQEAQPQKTYKSISTDEFDDYYSTDDYGVPGKRAGKRFHVSPKVIVFIVAYILFVAVGAFSTSFTTNEIGERKAQIVDVSMLMERESFYKLREQYLIIKNLLFMINEIDQQFLISGEDELFMISTQYQDILPQIDKVLPVARAIVVDTKYNSLKKQAENIYESIAIYLQKMGSALIEKNDVTFEEALTWRRKYYHDFEKFRLNLIEFSRIVKIEDESLVDNLPEIFSIDTEMDDFYEHNHETDDIENLQIEDEAEAEE